MNKLQKWLNAGLQLVLCCLMLYASFQAIYILMMGGSGTFLYLNAGLLGQYAAAHYLLPKYRRLLAILGLIWIFCFLIATTHLYSVWVLLVMVVGLLMLLGWAVYRCTLQCLCLLLCMGVLFMLPAQSMRLKELRQHYQYAIQGESWQQFGAL